MKTLFASIILLNLSVVHGQFGNVEIIDSSTTSSGITHILTADLNNDGLVDVLVSQASQTDKIAFYLNAGNGAFSVINFIDENISDPVYLATGDFNNNGWVDVATITQTNGEVFWYPNDNGTFSQRILLEEGIFFGNALVAADFDGDGTDDLVVIGQHSIDLFRNDGTGNFTKEEILTTQTSPNILECLYLETADMNNNGHADLIVGETLGGVIYFNDGNGNFTPQVFTNEGFIVTALHAFDTNNNGFTDVVVRYNTGDVYLYLNDGSGAMTSETVLFNAPAINSMQAVDVDGDGFLDLYTAYDQKARLHYNDGNSGFANSEIVYEESGLFINEVAIGDLNNNGIFEYIWSGAGNTLAYQNNTVLTIPTVANTKTGIYPNPALDKLHISLPNSTQATIKIYSFNGRLLLTHELIGQHPEIDVEHFVSGTYLIQIETEKDSKTKVWVKK